MYFYMSVREQRRPPASSPIIMHEYALPESSASPKDLSPLVSGTDLIVTILASSTMDQNITDAALSSPYDVKSCWWSRAVRIYLQTYDTRRRRDYEDIQEWSILASGYDWETRRFPDMEVLCQTRETCCGISSRTRCFWVQKCCLL